MITFKTLKEDKSLYIAFLFLSFSSSLFLVKLFFLDVDILKFYIKILNFHGAAPDQYRLLPYLILKFIWTIISQKLDPLEALKLSILIFNTIFLFLSYIVIFNFKKFFPSQKNIILIFLLFFGMLFVLSMQGGQRPVTSFYIFLISVLSTIYFQHRKYTGSFIIFYILLSISRPDLALVIFLSTIFYIKEKRYFYISFLGSIPFIYLLIAKFILFPDAKYYCKLFMLFDNLSLKYVVKNPNTYLVGAITIMYFSTIKKYIHYMYKNYKYFLYAFLFYFVLILFIGRIQELRLYIPLFPVYLYIFLEYKNLENAQMNSTNI